MSHLDEGTLHALLDGELETTEVAEIQAHLGSCSACGLRLREVKEFLGEADRLIASVNLGTEVVGAASLPAQREAAIRPDPIARPEPPARREPVVRAQPAGESAREPAVRPQPAGNSAREPWNEPPPMLLLPDNESPVERRMRRWRRAGWAALLVALVGAGFLGVRLRPQGGELPPLARVSPARSDAVVSPEEASRPDALTQLPESSALALNGRAPGGRADRPVITPPAPAPVNRNEPRATGQRELARQDTAARQADAAPARDDRSADEQAIDSAVAAAPEDSESEVPAGEDLTEVRERAGEALADLDRERRRNQAAAATAALDAERRRRPAPPPAAAAAAPTPPAPPTIEQRAQVYLRIGLDEASRQLGGPAHVIEGLNPMFMGLARGTAVGGADATRPVVRVVYQDAQGRLILLDQQRLRAGRAAPPAGPLAWLIGDTAMWLRGEASADILRTYQPRVR